MKRLVVCFDGTWKRANDEHVSNIEKLARTLRSEAGGIQQTVYYVGGVGASYKVDRVLGGALGLGLTNNLMSAYRFLALNYASGDSVYVLGFSRGAFTARCLVGMIDRVGLVRADALISGALKTAGERYRATLEQAAALADTAAEFRRDYCHDHVCVPFLGVFDTVEALGPRARFPNVDFLEGVVAVGRQALAIDERRRIFWPRLWTGAPHLAKSGRVRQVWFEGFHSDVGGGVRETGLPDTTLLWMAAAATKQGLAFDVDLLTAYLTASTGGRAKRHDSMNPAYQLTNLVLNNPLATSYGAFSGGWRALEPEGAVGVALSASALSHHEEGTYARPALTAWLRDRAAGSAPVEPVVYFPEPDPAVVHGVLSVAAADATAHGGTLHPCPTPR